jgi:hypothetical protein
MKRYSIINKATTHACMEQSPAGDWVQYKAAQQLERELNQWRECANKLASINLQTVPLICLEPDERTALSMLENLNNRRGDA